MTTQELSDYESLLERLQNKLGNVVKKDVARFGSTDTKNYVGWSKNHFQKFHGFP